MSAAEAAGRGGGGRLSRFPASVPGPTSWCQPSPSPRAGGRPARCTAVSPLRRSGRHWAAPGPSSRAYRWLRVPASPGWPDPETAPPHTHTHPTPSSDSPSSSEGAELGGPGVPRAQPPLQGAGREPGAQPSLPGPPHPRREGQAPPARPDGVGGTGAGRRAARPSQQEGAAPPGGRFSEDLTGARASEGAVPGRRGSGTGEPALHGGGPHTLWSLVGLGVTVLAWTRGPQSQVLCLVLSRPGRHGDREASFLWERLRCQRRAGRLPGGPPGSRAARAGTQAPGAPLSPAEERG